MTSVCHHIVQVFSKYGVGNDIKYNSKECCHDSEISLKCQGGKVQALFVSVKCGNFAKVNCMLCQPEHFLNAMLSVRA